jgi:hypothetical protein
MIDYAIKHFANELYEMLKESSNNMKWFGNRYMKNTEKLIID